MEASAAHSNWYLEGYLHKEKRLRRWLIRPLPYHIGRNSDMDLRLPFDTVSGEHAQLYLKGSSLWVCDLNSTNGTFLNRKRLGEDVGLQDGDTLHFSEFEFRVGCLEIGQMHATGTIKRTLSETDLPEKSVVKVREFQQMLLNQMVTPYFQPVVRLEDKARIGYEVLGRGNQEGLASLPSELFRIASTLGVEAELSRLFRLRGFEDARNLKGESIIFLNSHPAELDSEKLMTSLANLRSRQRNLPMVLEIHETAVADLKKMRELREQLADLDIGFAYDDFGAGQARLVELVEVPPDYLKFDISLVKEIHKAPSAKQKLVESLVRMATDIGAPCVAEGIEVQEEHTVCLQMGFELAQGYLYGRPAPLKNWID